MLLFFFFGFVSNYCWNILSCATKKFFTYFCYKNNQKIFLNIFVIRREPEPSYMKAHKWFFQETSENPNARFRYSNNS